MYILVYGDSLMQSGKVIHYGWLNSYAKRELSAALDQYSNHFIRITVEEFKEDTSKPVRISIPEKTRNRLKQSRRAFNLIRDKPLSMEQYINYLLDMEENSK